MNALRLRLPLATALALVAPACLDLAPAPPPPIRWFDATPPVPDEPPDATPRVPELRLRRVTAARSIGERIVWRRSSVETGFHDDRRWATDPRGVLERALERELFERRGFARDERAERVLDVELVALEEVLAPERAARVVLAVQLTGPTGASLLDRTLERTEPVPTEDTAAFAAAAARALGDAVVEVGGLAAAR